MTYKEFRAWCNDRACDGCWSITTAIFCRDIIKEIEAVPFWKKEKAWREVSEFIEKEVVEVINEKIARVQNG